MQIKYLGNEYGGWKIDLDLINDGDTIVCGGLGEDMSFEEELIKYKNVFIVEIDPTEKSHVFFEKKSIKNSKLIKKAIESKHTSIVKIFKNKVPNYVSESANNTHGYASNIFYESEVISIEEIKKIYNPSFIKLDIEGSEYNVIEDCVGIKQICVEFHHHCLNNKKIEDTLFIVDKFLKNGYEIIDNRNNFQEITFVLKNI